MAQDVASPVTADEDSEVRERFQRFMVARGFRVTSQRLAILEAVMGFDEHFTAEDLLERAREVDRSVSRATIYRTLPILTDSGLVRELDVGKDYKFYAVSRGTQNEQSQVICLDCDKIFDLDAPFLEWYAQSISRKVGLEPEGIRLQVRARCPKFRKGDCSYAGHSRSE